MPVYLQQEGITDMEQPEISSDRKPHRLRLRQIKACSQ